MSIPLDGPADAQALGLPSHQPFEQGNILLRVQAVSTR
jgi:hypothetical protein